MKGILTWPRNPWKKIAALEAEIKTLTQECEYLDRMATEAIGRAADYYNRRFTHENAQRAAMEQHISQLASLSPQVFTILPDFDAK